MAAAEYYNAAATQAPTNHSPYHQSPYQRPHELHGSPVPSQPLPQSSHVPQQYQYPPPPPYHPIQQDQNPAVHFGSTPLATQQHRPSVSSSGRPSFSNQTRPAQGQFLQPHPHHSPLAQHGSPHLSPQMAVQPPHMRPYMNGNQSEYALNSGYSSDPEQRRRRRHKHHERRDDEASSRDTRPRKNRSRSTNADGFFGAAGGGIIGDLIFPGLGTVGGAVAGWIGGKDYGKHRKQREDKLQREQREWEHKFRSRSHSGDERHDHNSHDDSKHHSRY